MERKICLLPQLKLAKAEGEADAGSFTGYAAAFNNVDSQNERIIPGAFKNSIEHFLSYGFIAIGHDWMSLPVATPMKAEEDETGLLITADFHSTPDAQAARTVVRERLSRDKIVGLSIGYDVIADRKAKDGVRELVEVQVHETSIVTLGANDQAVGIDAKGARAALTLEDHSKGLLAGLEKWIERLDGLYAIRAKESRTLSAASIADIDSAIEHAAAIVKRLKALKERAAPAPKDEEGKRLEREFLRLRLSRQAHRELMGG